MQNNAIMNLVGLNIHPLFKYPNVTSYGGFQVASTWGVRKSYSWQSPHHLMFHNKWQLRDNLVVHLGEKLIAIALNCDPCFLESSKRRARDLKWRAVRSIWVVRHFASTRERVTERWEEWTFDLPRQGVVSITLGNFGASCVSTMQKHFLHDPAWPHQCSEESNKKK